MSLRFFNKPAKARLSSGKKGEALFASFQDSVEPTLWHCPLRQLKNATISLREIDGVFELVTKERDKDFIVIARFDEEEQAMQALHALRKAFLNETVFPRFGPWARLIFALLFLMAALFFILIPSSGEIAKVKASLQGQITQKINEQKDSSKKSHEIIPGVPVNADDVLVPPLD
ncbi:MAG: hypothetical protein AB7S81_05870 [Bdellovibrionales bacterium]